MFRFPCNNIAYHQPNNSGYISPRKLVKAQQTIASSKYGCLFLNGQAESIEKPDENLFCITVKRYLDEKERVDGKENTQTLKVQAKRIIIATGAYANVKPDLQVR